MARQFSEATKAPGDQRPAMARIRLRGWLDTGLCARSRRSEVRFVEGQECLQTFSLGLVSDSTKYGDRTVKSTRLVRVCSIMNVTVAKLRIRQSQNVEHGLLPFPLLRGNGRSLMLGIHTGGVRHPSSETNTTASRVVVRSGLMSGCRWDVRCRIVPAFVASKCSSSRFTHLSKLAGYTNSRERNAVPTPLSEQYEEPSIR